MSVNTITARNDFNDYMKCYESNKYNKNVKDVCSNQLNKAIGTTTSIISRECMAQTENLYKCFKHSFRLSFCDKDIIEKLKTCQSNVYKLITS
ncbi:conserved Plasmodium protein, unknown function [Plasmodium berghei]|uniref:Uncharacterized protein n=2 Tax=Plasmodium berghei TaxID=5821 RepID=A0A509AX00_PLABA|nr:conserved Plasmodium protein, unknown function [Plasmodium berghei ANKA]CXI96154.1 conserved Plasmodium protein, unknown function [Plasmodium berghei]SCL97275.1 conserved Plasmodium protein, unknown function [Plasmodium berghei]SCM16586.1 conserved Plasmodium protein, unknown function [Plasmodium berghei]SCM18383.1 conserved Plasmodium protein, unknown function [Plasmodium berghei]SCN27813.1 conserved Plasmodium protein, unknown function [Plasmodium berghei]|eukprot:XP_034423467.1 conserved Plasmodium protein, unknown function [Plasmodium berghei ANKA]